MTLNTSNKAIIENRRRRVGALRLRGATVREIQDALEKRGLVNPKTDKPYSLGIISNDIRYLEKEWRKTAVSDITELKSIQLAEIQEARRLAWQKGSLADIHRFLKMEIELLGTEAPKQAKIDQSGDVIYRFMWETAEDPGEAKETIEEWLQEKNQ